MDLKDDNAFLHVSGIWVDLAMGQGAGMTRSLLRLSVLIILLIALAAGWAAWLQANGNFHAVIVGELYRSAQPDAAHLEKWVADHRIRSVVNLRGASEAEWYRAEREASARLSLTHVDFAMRDSEMIPAGQAQDLIALMFSLPKPILIHCKAGSDRTGLAAALYLASHGYGEATAERQISFRYGHVSLPFSAAWPMDLSWEELEPGLGYAR